MSEGPGIPLDVQDLLRLILRRRWLLILPWGVAVVVGLAGALLLPPVFFSSVTLLLERPQQLSGQLSTLGGGNPEAQAEVMREQVKSSLFLSSVITNTGLRTDPETRKWAAKSAKRFPGLSEEESIDLFLTNYVREATAIQRSKGNIFKVTVADFDRDRARRLAEGIANQFVATSKAQQLEAVRETHEFSMEQQQVYRHRLEESEARLEVFRRNALSSSMIGSSVGQTNLQRARLLLDQANFEVDDLKVRESSARAAFAGKAQENDPQLLNSGQTASLAAQIGSLERQLANAQLGEGTADNLGSVRLSIARRRAELEVELGINAARALPQMDPAVREQLVAYRVAQVDRSSVESRRDWLASQVGGYERTVVSTPVREMEEKRLSQEVENNRQLYSSFLQQSSIAQIAEAFENAKVSGRFVVLEPATRPLRPGKPNRPMLLLLSFMAGGIIGVGTVLMVERQDQSVRNADEVENMLGLPVLGTVPRVHELERSRRRPRGGPGLGVPPPREHGLLHRLKVESPLGLEFRRTYLKLAKSRGRQLPHTLAITSATRGEGKTTTTACLAITIARELRQKVLLVDFDLRSPALHRALGLPSSSWGVAQMLHQRHFDERFVRATVVPHLEFLPAGKSDRPASELMDNDAVEWFVREAAQRYPIVIIDSAPNLAVPDSLILGRLVEGVIYVIKAGSTVRKAAEYGVKVQREARENVLGVLINVTGEVLPSYYGYRYNYYGYASPEAAGVDS